MLVIGCPYCGASIVPGAMFCGNCGALTAAGMQQQGPMYKFGQQAKSLLQSLKLSRQTLMILFCLAVIISLGVFAYKQFQPEPDTTPPTISNITVAYSGKTSSQIEWHTNEPASTQVKYGSTINYGFVEPKKPQNDPSSGTETGVTKHVAFLNGLKSGTIYHYVVISKDAAGNESVSKDMTFKTVEDIPFFNLDDE